MPRLGPGSPEPLGVTLTSGGINVAVFSVHATSIELCLFDAQGGREQERIALPERTGDVFHGFVADIAAGQRYGLRAHGAFDPRNGHRFNPAKLLIDPYATALDRHVAYDVVMTGSDASDTAPDPRDSAAAVAKAIVAAAAPRAESPRPRVPWADTILYELNVRGFTMTHSGVPPALRGTLAGLAHPSAIAHLTRLGVTTVELMPIVAAIDERHLGPLGLTNYWRYNPIAWMAVAPHLAPGGLPELAACVRALHAAGLEVIQDIVLNHSGEGDAPGPTLSLRGLDNASYYRLAEGDAARYVDDTCCGNTLALDHPYVLRLALDSLRHFAQAAGVDGFRFDLATTLGRRTGGFDPAAPLLQAIAQDPMLRGLKLIAEPWDPGPGGYRLGQFPAGWGEWNDRSRDAVRRFWRGDAGMQGALATRLSGSSDVFAARARPPVALDQLRHRARRLHAGGSGRLFGQAQRSERRGQPRRQRPQRLVEPRRRGPDRRRRDRRGARARREEPARDVDGGARHADAVDGRRARAHTARQQQRVCAGQCAGMGRLGPCRRRAGRFRRRALRVAPRAPRAARRSLARRRAGRCIGDSRCRMAPSRWQRAHARRLDRVPGTGRSSPASTRARPTTARPTASSSRSTRAMRRARCSCPIPARGLPGAVSSTPRCPRDGRRARARGARRK